MKKLLWVIAALFVSFAAAAQNRDSEGRIIINSAEEFLKIGTTGYPSNGNYIQTANIDLGNMGTLDTAIIKLFRGTYDGGRHSISYSATFRGKSHKSENGGYRCEQHDNGGGNYYGDYGLFGFLKEGVIKNLNLSGDILIIPYPGDACNDMNYALLCGHAFCGSTIDHCNVSGTVNSQVEGQKGGGDAGLLVGQADGATIQYCTGSGNVSSIGWVGGLIGSGGHNDSITIKACTFSGSVQASRAKSNTAKPEELEKGYGGFAGGIIGFAGKHGLNNWQSVEPSVSIDLCYVNANITATNVVSGIASVAMGAGTATVKNSCAEGSITKTEQNGETDTTTNSTTHTVQSNTYDSNDKTVDELERIVEALNRGRAPGEKAEFDVVNGQIVLYLNGKPAEPCAAVTGLTISSVTPGSLTCSWTAGGSETAWNVSISGGGLTEDITKSGITNQDVTITDDSLATITITDDSLTTSQSNYVLSVVADCEGDGPNSIPTTSSFVISCPTITGMSVTPDYTSATVAWSNTETVKAELYQGEARVGGPTITSEQLHTFTSLTPNTTYKVKLSAACGGGVYGEATERVFTTPSLPIVENVQIAARYEDGGSVAITWGYALDGATYQVEVQTSGGSPVENRSGLTTESYDNESSIAVGSYQARIKATYQGHEAGWTEWFPFVISSPNAPQNVHWSDTAIVDSQYKLTLAWTKGNDVTIQSTTEANNGSGQGWEIKVADSTSNTPTVYPIEAISTTGPDYTYTQEMANPSCYVTPGSSQTFYIRENTWTQPMSSDPIESTKVYSYSYWFPITFVAPCFEIEGTPTAEDITQTSATLSGLRSGYGVVLSDGTDTTNYEVSGETLSLTGLASATHYTAEVRSYCNQEKYSSKTVEFTTVGCYSPTNVKVTDITPLQAKVSWTQGNPHLSGLLFYYILEEKEINGTYTQVGDTVKGYSGISKTFTNLKHATEYRVSVAEQCGTNYGIPTTITFTTSTPGNFVAISEGNWDNATTWQDGRIPNGIGTITINNGVTVTLDRTLVLTEDYTLTNNGTLLINKGELVNTTNNNNLGNVRISFTATQNKWKFIGAPFTSVQDSKYRLESIEPVPNSDVAVVLYDYSSGKWSTNWATINDRVPRAEGYFAWPFYNGTITFNNDYNTDNRVDYSLNNSNITVTRDVINYSSNGYWMSLANPYPAKLDIEEFLSDNSAAGFQGGVVYNFNGTSFVVTDGRSGSLPVCEGFFVNFSSGGNKSVTFKKTQMTSYPSENNTKSKTAQNPWIEMSLVNKIDKVKFFFVRNPLAEQGYDKYDANKLFATTGVAEPYFVTDGMNLVKEEVKDLPYYATLNVRSEQDTLMTFVADKIPEGYRVSLIDGEQTIEMNEGSRYETNISAGENADRFKLLIQNNVGLNQVSQADITITNSNRHVAISAEAISNVEVFNALGQRVYQTKASTFTLSGVQSGVYVVRVSTAKGTKSQKIVVE
ncbi:MAG: fibronectin type III domain-containing protein [Bacteroidales bacterium]|nr:fibronectin type III domain-containing protein [Bacteroidales bacterium]